MSVPRGARRAALVLLALALAAASFAAYQQAGRAGQELAAQAMTSAEHVAAALGSTLTLEDLEGPVRDERYQTISSYLSGGVLRPNETAKVLNQAAVVVFAADREILGHRQSRAKITRALSLGTQSELADGMFTAFVPVTVGEGSEMAIVEISGPSGPIESARRSWIIVALAAALFAAMVLVFAFVRGGRSAGFGDAISPSRVLDIERRHQKEMEGLEKTLERARADEGGVQTELDKTAKELEAHKRVLTELDEAVSKAEERAGTAEGQLADAHKAAAEAQARANHAESGESEARARITAAESRAKDAEREAADATTRARQAEEWANDLAALGDDLERAGTGDDAEFKKLRGALLEAKRQAASTRDSKRILQERVTKLESESGTLQAERAALIAERESLIAEREALVAEHATVEQARAAAENETAVTRGELERTQGELDQAVASSKAQLAGARRELEEGGAELAAARRELEAARAREAQANAQVESAKAEAVRIGADLDSAKADSEAARSATQAKSVQLADATDQLSTAHRETETLTGQLREQTDRASAAEAKVVELFHQVQSLEQRPDLTDDLEAARAEVAALQASLATSNERMETLEGDVGLARSEADVAQRAGAEIADRLNDQRARADRAEAEVADLREEIAELTNVIGELEARPDLTADLEASAAQVGKLTRRIAELEARPDLTADLESAKSEGSVIAAQLETAKSELEAARAETETSRAETETARAETETSRAETETSRAETETARAELETARAELDTARAELDTSRTEIEASQAEIEASQAETETARTELGASQAELETSRAETETARAETETARTELETSRTELETSRTKAKALKAELEAARAAVGKTEAGERTLQEQLRAARAELEASRTKAKAVKAELEAARAAVGKTEAGERTLQEQLRAARTELEASQTEAEAAKGELETVKAELAGSTTELGATTSELARVSAELQKTANELADTRTAAGKTEADQLTLAAELRTTSEEAEARRREDESLRAEVESHRVEQERLRAELETWRVESDGLRAQLDLVTAEADGLRAEADDLRAESESVRAGTESLRSESTELLQEKDRLIEQLQSSEWSAGQERARAEDLARRQAELQAHADEVARKAAEEAIETRGRLMETQEALARFQAELEETATHSVTAAQVGLDPAGVQEVVDALSTDAKRSLSAIFGLARMMSTQTPAQDEGRLLQQLMSQARRMEHALADILDAERISRGEIVLKRRSTELDTLIRRVVREFPAIEDRQIDVLVDSATIQIDPARLERLIDDLLTAAVARTPRGERVVLRLEGTSDGVMLSVEGGAPSGIEVGAAAAFLAKLHGGHTSAELLPGERGVARVFLPNSGTPRAEPTEDGTADGDGSDGPETTSDPTDRAAATA